MSFVIVITKNYQVELSLPLPQLVRTKWMAPGEQESCQCMLQTSSH